MIPDKLLMWLSGFGIGFVFHGFIAWLFRRRP